MLLIYFSVALFPYTFYWLLVERMDRDQRIANAQRALMELRRNGGDDERTIRFADDKGNVKLIVSTDRVISIESAGNYVNILYENNGKLVRFSLRNTLKGIEELCDSYSLVRCHRSYFINLHKVKLLRKESDGVFAEIDAEGVEDIPVSKSYAADVMQRFASRLACLLLFLLPFGPGQPIQPRGFATGDGCRMERGLARRICGEELPLWRGHPLLFSTAPVCDRDSQTVASPPCLRARHCVDRSVDTGGTLRRHGRHQRLLFRHESGKPYLLPSHKWTGMR